MQLKEGKKVLFSGTPCHATALYNFIPSKYHSNLVVIDVVCHGVPSPGIWKKYLEYICNREEKSITDITSIEFKEKDQYTYHWTHPGFKIKWKDGKVYEDFSNHTWYENGFLGNLYVRPACHYCNQKELRSRSDIQIGDFWGCEKVYPDFMDEDGVSIVIIKSIKGKELFEKAKQRLLYKKITYQEAYAHNPRIIKAAKPNLNRNQFWKTIDISSSSGEEISEKVETCLRYNTFQNIEDRIRNHF